MRRLINVMKRLRGPGGCPWDKKQTLYSLCPCLIEESAEVIDAVIEEDREKITEELGDLLCIVSMMVAIGEEDSLFSKDDVIKSAVAKMKRRHPHVFSNKKAITSSEAYNLWHSEKEKEKGIKKRTSAMDEISSFLPALSMADKIGRRAARNGFDWDNPNDVVSKIYEELDELKDEIGRKKINKNNVTEEVGDLLFAVVNLARKLKVNAETALIKANKKFISRFKKVEKRVKSLGLSMRDMNLEELDKIWDEIKK